MDNARIAAVVVTYNRLQLLKKCVESLRNQTKRLDEIFIINNSSTDGTLKWLQEQNDLTTITQENSGGAGGFYTGIKTAYEKGYDWIWCFDDDCEADEKALEMLFTIEDNFLVRNSTVVEKGTDNLSFGLYDRKESIYYSYYSQIKHKGIIHSANFFNGTLLYKNLIKRIGYPNKNLFIWGDAYEFYIKAKNYIPPITINNSIVYHPKEPKILIKLGKYYLQYKLKAQKKKYFYYRNIIWLRKLYKSEVKIKTIVKDSLMEIIFSILLGDLISLRNSIIGIKDGIRQKMR